MRPSCGGQLVGIWSGSSQAGRRDATRRPTRLRCSPSSTAAKRRANRCFAVCLGFFDWTCGQLLDLSLTPIRHLTDRLWRGRAVSQRAAQIGSRPDTQCIEQHSCEILVQASRITGY
ncbi:hypothetical protein GQ43DRAFT_47961 [Delitschia confertaspora ATCC 74209]|uniref:Uncharacterized protein n=1 Tax=Delitschia confertaspora ATCC 74209 TaxID=1513339 RepID=A0A9P4JKI6_9PLEO|nr:hypothetical protein GQ43DRAFT_47961 [Delitschia confertaspora ATCC 74209]